MKHICQLEQLKVFLLWLIMNCYSKHTHKCFFISLLALAAENEPVQLSHKPQGALCCGRFVSSP